MPILILINVKYLQIVVLSFEKYLNGHSSDSHQPIKQSLSPYRSSPTPYNNAVWKILGASQIVGWT